MIISYLNTIWSQHVWISDAFGTNVPFLGTLLPMATARQDYSKRMATMAKEWQPWQINGNHGK